MHIDTSIALEVIRLSERVSRQLRDGLVACWVDTTKAGGAVGFPWLPVTRDDIGDLDDLVARIDAGHVAAEADRVVGCVVLERNQHPLVCHWATVRHLQTHPTARRRGIGQALMTELMDTAREDGLRQLHLALRGGMGLEDFYRTLGWQVVGTWPKALRLAEDDYRDEVLMALDL